MPRALSNSPAEIASTPELNPALSSPSSGPSTALGSVAGAAGDGGDEQPQTRPRPRTLQSQVHVRRFETDENDIEGQSFGPRESRQDFSGSPSIIASVAWMRRSTRST